METIRDPGISITAALDQVVAAFDEELRSEHPFIRQLLRRIGTSRGKLLRPRLLLLAAEATGEIGPAHVVLGAVVEMIHIATLVHDDVLDEAEIRRRAPTVNRLIGNEGAVLLGDYLISHAYHLCSSLPTPTASRRIAAATDDVCEGELMQIANRGNFELSQETYLEIVRRKTAALTCVCCELGAQFAGADAETVRMLADFGLDLGVAYQIIDDLLDLTATEGEMGKSVGRDADLGTLTLPLIRFLATAEPPARQRLLSVLADGPSNKNQEARIVLNGSGAVEYASGVAHDFVRSAVERIAPLPAGDAKDGLLAAAEFVLKRRL